MVSGGAFIALPAVVGVAAWSLLTLLSQMQRYGSRLMRALPSTAPMSQHGLTRPLMVMTCCKVRRHVNPCLSPVTSTGNPGLDFSGAEKQLFKSGINQGDLTQAWEVFFVARQQATLGASARPLDLSNGVTGLQVTATTTPVYIFDAGTADLQLPTAAANEPLIFDILGNSANSFAEYTTDDGTLRVDGDIGSEALTQIFVGARAGIPTQNWESTINEVIVFPRELSFTERNQVKRYLGSKYGIAQDPIGALGPAVWLDAGEGITLNGSGVSAWEDQSGWGNDATQATPANQPLFSASVAELNGQPAVTNIDDADVLDTGSYSQGNLPAECEHFIVSTKPSGAIAANAFVTSGGLPSGRGDLFFVPAGNLAFYGGSQLSSATTTYDGSGYIANVATGASGCLTLIDDSGETTVNGSTGTQQMSKLRTGNLSGSGSILASTAEIIIFPRKLSFTERDQVMTYLSGKYGIPYVTPLPYPLPTANFLGADFDGTAIANTEDGTDVLNLYGDQQGAVVTRKGHQAIHLTGDTRMGSDDPGFGLGRYPWPGGGGNTLSMAFVVEWQVTVGDSNRPAIWGSDRPDEIILMGSTASPSSMRIQFGPSVLEPAVPAVQGDLVVVVVSLDGSAFHGEFRNITTGASTSFDGVTDGDGIGTCWFNDIVPSTSVGFAPENYWFKWSMWPETLSNSEAAAVADEYAAEFA